MPEYGSVFSDEIRTHLSIREVELSSEAYRHYRRTVTLFDEYLCRINHTEKRIAESVIEGWIKEISAGISVNTSSLHVHYIRQLLLYLTGCGYPCFIPRTVKTKDTYVPYRAHRRQIPTMHMVSYHLYLCSWQARYHHA